MRFISKAKSVVAALSMMAGLPVLAEGTNPVDTTQAATAVGNIKDAISGLFTDNLIPAVLTIIGVCLAIAIIFLSVKYLMRAGKQGK